jgi:hypothetical protein
MIILVSHICAGGTTAVMAVSARVARQYHRLARQTRHSMRAALAKMLRSSGVDAWFPFMVCLLGRGAW